MRSAIRTRYDSWLSRTGSDDTPEHAAAFEAGFTCMIELMVHAHLGSVTHTPDEDSGRYMLDIMGMTPAWEASIIAEQAAYRGDAE